MQTCHALQCYEYHAADHINNYKTGNFYAVITLLITEYSFHFDFLSQRTHFTVISSTPHASTVPLENLGKETYSTNSEK